MKRLIHTLKRIATRGQRLAPDAGERLPVSPVGQHLAELVGRPAAQDRKNGGNARGELAVWASADDSPFRRRTV